MCLKTKHTKVEISDIKISDIYFNCNFYLYSKVTLLNPIKTELLYSGCLKSGLVRISESNFQELARTDLVRPLFIKSNFLYYKYNTVAGPNFGIWAGQNCVWISAFYCMLTFFVVCIKTWGVCVK